MHSNSSSLWEGGEGLSGASGLCSGWISQLRLTTKTFRKVAQQDTDTLAESERTLSHNTKSAFMMPLVELSDVDPSYKPRVLRALKPSPALPEGGRF